MKIALIGLGEVGRVLAQDLAATGLTAWDTAFGDPNSLASKHAVELYITPGAGAQEAVTGAELVISAVTAANDYGAAEAVASFLTSGAWFLDLNSASPVQKQHAAQVIDAAGGRYVEAAVMSPIEPKRLSSPVLLGGPHASDFAEIGRSVGFTGLEVYADTVGPASATKLCRSVLVKGMEALMTESLLTARDWGVEKRVLDSLSNMFSTNDWQQLATYLISRSLQHGQRRSEEMAEAAATVAAAGVDPWMSNATVQRQAWAGQRSAALDSASSDSAGLDELLDALRAHDALQAGEITA